MPASTHKVGSPINVWQALGNIFINQSTNLKQYWDQVGEITRVKHDSLCDFIDSDIATKAETVKLTGDQTIAGKKTFSSVPTIPDPVAETDASNKKYVDAELAKVVLGQIPDGTLTDAKLGADIKIGSLATLLTTVKTSVVGAINEVFTALGTLGTTVSGIVTTLTGKAEKDTEIILVTTDKTFALPDKATFQQCYSATPMSHTIPKDIFPVKAEIVVARDGAGTVAIAPATDVTLHSIDEKRNIKLYGSVTLKQVALNDWRMYGAIE